MAEEIDDTKGFWESLFGGNEEAKAREMVQAPPPELILPDKADYTDDNLAYRMAVRKAKFEHKKALEAYKENPEDYMVPAAAAEETPEEHAAVRRKDIMETMKEYEQ